jgi:phosphohistidine swiveling domain-containing protein
MAPMVVPLSRRKASDLSVAGGKGAGLARLMRAGYPVPLGFVITAAAFQDPLDSAIRLAGLGRRSVKGDRSKPGRPGPDESPPPESSAETATPRDLEASRRFCLDWEMPEKLRRAILDAYRRLGAGLVAVRSSMVGEDAAAASFAGQLESVLEVTGDAALLEAVRRVLASAFGDRLWAYLRQPSLASPADTDTLRHAPASSPAPLTSPALSRASHRTILPPLSLAVVVQSMVRAEVSGVAFSVDPVTCRPGVVIEAVPGLCEALVQGRARPDRYRLDPRGELDEAVPARPGAPLLDEPMARDLGELIRSIADRAEAPQDVEWALADGRFHILQARPISSIAGKPVYSRRMVSDMAPGLVKPLVWSAKYAPIVQNVFAPAFERIAGRTGIDYSAMSARLYSRVYMNISVFGELFKRVGLPPNLFYVMAREDKAARVRVRFRIRMVPAVVRLGRFVWRESRVGRRVGPFLESQNGRLDESRRTDWAAQAPEALVGRFRRLKELHAATQWYIIIVSANMLIRSRLLGKMIVRRWPGTDPRDVIKGYGRRSSLAPFEEMKKLAEEARHLDRGLVERLAGEDGSARTAALRDSERGRALLEGFERFMGRYGFLSANGSDFSEVPWIEDPRLVWKSIARLALAPESPSSDAAEAHRDDVLGLVRTGFGPFRRRLFDRLHASTVRFIDWRERVSLLMTEDSYQMRRCSLALGAKLVERGALTEAADIFFLYEGELEQAGTLGSGPGEGGTVAQRVAERKAELAEHESLDPPDTLCGGELPHLASPRAEGLTYLSGIGASAGVRKGRARIVHNPALEGGGLGAEDILIVPFTDVGWLPILSGVGGIVAESGGQLSHTSIIAREFGMPAVVSVGNATRLIRDGQLITIDGTAGRVYLHSEDGI